MTNNILRIIYMNSMPSNVDAVSDGYLLYDVEEELFAGAATGWNGRVMYLLLGDDLDLCEGYPVFYQAHTNRMVELANEILLVPCQAYEKVKGDTLYVYQIFDWKWAIPIKSMSGALYRETLGEI